MDRSGFLVIAIVVGYLAFEVYGVHSSRHLMESTYIFDRYTAAQRAVERCGNAGEADHARFANNISVMRRKAAATLREAEPSLDDAALEARLERRVDETNAEVDALVDEQGCDGKDLFTLTKTYEQSARLRLR